MGIRYRWASALPAANRSKAARENSNCGTYTSPPTSQKVSSSDRVRAELFYGDDLVYVSAYPVCGKIFGVVLAPAAS